MVPKMMETTYVFLLSLLCCFAITGAADCEDGWMAYKDELCIKAIETDDLLAYEQAAVLCSLQGDAGTLLMVKDSELQELVTNYTQDVPDNMWLGGKYDTQSGIFKWEDGEPLTYTNWADGFPKNISKSEICISLRKFRSDNAGTSDNVEAKWEGVACGTRNLVLCQKALRGTLQDAKLEHQSTKQDLEKEVGAVKTGLKSTNHDLEGTKQDHESTNQDHDGTNQDRQKTKERLEKLFSMLKIRVRIYQITRNIQNDNPEMAFEEFQKLEDIWLLRTIVKDVYNRNPENVEKITNFVKLLRVFIQVALAHLSLYDEIEDNGHLTSPQILIFHNAVNSWYGRSFPRYMQIKSSVDIVITTWTSSIRSGNYDPIMEFTKQYPQTFQNNLPNLVKAAYSNNLSNFQIVLDFVHSLPDYSKLHTGYNALISEMSSDSHRYSYEMVKLAYRIRETMKLSSYPSNSDELKRKYLALKYRLPSNVVELIWKGNLCVLKNKRYGEFLFAANDDYDFNSDSRKVFTYVPGGVERYELWTFETTDGGNSYSMYNGFWKEYIYASGDTKDSDRRWVDTWKRGGKVTEGFWKLKPVDSEIFTLVNTVHNEYLYANGDMSQGSGSGESRGVFTYRGGVPTGDMVEESQWILYCIY